MPIGSIIGPPERPLGPQCPPVTWLPGDVLGNGTMTMPQAAIAASIPSWASSLPAPVLP